MADWQKLNMRGAAERMGIAHLRKAQEHAAESAKRSRTLFHGRVPSGRLIVARGPIMPVPDDKGELMPTSATPVGYMIIWYGNLGADYPAEVDDNVLMRAQGTNGCKAQMWSAENADDVKRILKEAFKLEVILPVEEKRS